MRGEEHSASLCTGKNQNDPWPKMRQSSTSLTQLLGSWGLSVWLTEDFTTNQMRTGQVQCWMQFVLSAEQISGCSVLLTRSGIQCFLLFGSKPCVLKMQLLKGTSPRESEESWIVDQVCFVLFLNLWKKESVPCHKPKSVNYCG